MHMRQPTFLPVFFQHPLATGGKAPNIMRVSTLDRTLLKLTKRRIHERRKTFPGGIQRTPPPDDPLNLFQQGDLPARAHLERERRDR